MARSSVIEDLFRITSQIPWWISTALGGGFFYVFKYHLPTKVSDSLQAVWTPMFSTLAYLLLGVCLAGAATSAVRNLRGKRLFDRQTSVLSIRELSWLEFEQFVLEAYLRQGYQAHLTSAGADGGVDLVLEADGIRTLVQCKQWKTRRVGVKPIRELAGVVAAEKAQGGIFVCSGTYTNAARTFARNAKIELVDGKMLEELIKPERREFERAMEAPPIATLCPKCGSDLARRIARRGNRAGQSFLGCASYPKCRYTRNLEQH